MAEGFEFLNVHEFLHRMEETVAEVDKATEGFIAEGAHAIEREAKIRAGAGGRHKAGTPTPATTGDGPAIITGTLRRSIHVDGPHRLGLGTYEASVGPSVIYGRRVELEYNYPYLSPALAQVSDTLLPELARKWWGSAWRG